MEQDKLLSSTFFAPLSLHPAQVIFCDASKRICHSPRPTVVVEWHCFSSHDIATSATAQLHTAAMTEFAFLNMLRTPIHKKD